MHIAFKGANHGHASENTTYGTGNTIVRLVMETSLTARR